MTRPVCRRCGELTICAGRICGRCKLIERGEASARPHLRRAVVSRVGAAAPSDALMQRARRVVFGPFATGDHSSEPSKLCAVSLEYDRLLRAAGLPVLVANEPPPGWSPEGDRREELLALGEHLALRRVS